MNGVHPDDETKELLADFHGIADDPIRALGEERRRLRAVRRAAAINIVNMARDHAGNKEELYSQSDADVLMMIMELLDKVAAQ